MDPGSRLPLDDLPALADNYLLLTADEEVTPGKPRAERIADKHGIQLPAMLVCFVGGVHESDVPGFSKVVQVLSSYWPKAIS